MSTTCVVVAAGRGERLAAGRPKALVDLAGRTLLGHALEAVAASGVVDDVVVVVPADEVASPEVRAALAVARLVLPAQVVAGGATRHASVAAGLALLPLEADTVLVHDAARALAPPELVAAVVAAVARGVDAVVPGVPLADTVKEVDRASWVRSTPDRVRLRAVQTPQGFRRSVLLEAHARAGAHGSEAAARPTDDAGLVERLGRSVLVVPGSPEAFKITGPLDLLLAEAVLAARAAATTAATAATAPTAPTSRSSVTSVPRPADVSGTAGPLDHGSGGGW